MKDELMKLLPAWAISVGKIVFMLLKYVAYFLFVYMEIEKDPFIVLVTLMAWDSGVGSIASIRVGDRFSFKILGWGALTKFLFLGLFGVVALVGKGLGYDWTLMVDWVMKIMVVSEGISILTNLYIIKTQERIKKVDLITMLLKAVRSKMIKLGASMINGIVKDDTCKIDDDNEPIEK